MVFLDHISEIKSIRESNPSISDKEFVYKSLVVLDNYGCYPTRCELSDILNIKLTTVCARIDDLIREGKVYRIFRNDTDLYCSCRSHIGKNIKISRVTVDQSKASVVTNDHMPTFKKLENAQKYINILESRFSLLEQELNKLKADVLAKLKDKNIDYLKELITDEINRREDSIIGYSNNISARYDSGFINGLKWTLKQIDLWNGRNN